MTKVFLSYATEDRKKVEVIRDYLKLWKIDSVIDYLDFRSGHHLHQTIRSSIESSSFFCPVFSPSAVSSVWVLDLELPHAIDTGVRIIPILLEECQMPVQLHHIRYVDFTMDWNAGFVDLLRALPRGDYDELEYLRKAFADERLGATGSTLLPILKQAALQQTDWTNHTPLDFMKGLRRIGQENRPNSAAKSKKSGTERQASTRGYLNHFYWWLNVYGVFRFRGIEPEDMAYGEEYWQNSVDCALITPRGIQFLNDLSLEMRTHEEIRKALRKRSAPRRASLTGTSHS